MLKIAEDAHVIEHRRVLGGDWIRVQIVGNDMLEWAQDQVAVYNEQSGCGDWRIRPADAKPPKRTAQPPASVVDKPTFRQRLRWRWIMLTSKRAR